MNESIIGTADEAIKTYLELKRRICQKAYLAQKEEDIEEDIQVLLKLGDAGFDNAYATAGLIYLMSGKPWYNRTLGLKYLTHAAKSDDPLSLYGLADVYYYGRKDIPADSSKAKYWLSKAVKAGLPEAEIEWRSRYNN